MWNHSKWNAVIELLGDGWVGGTGAKPPRSSGVVWALTVASIMYLVDMSFRGPLMPTSNLGREMTKSVGAKIDVERPRFHQAAGAPYCLTPSQAVRLASRSRQLPSALRYTLRSKRRSYSESCLGLRTDRIHPHPIRNPRLSADADRGLAVQPSVG